MKMQIILKNGTQITVDVESFTTKRHQLTGELTNMQWVTPDDWKIKLHTIELDQIAAIVTLSED